MRSAPSLDPSLIPCGDCGAANPRERKFCSQCGKSLWRPCDNCGEVNAVAENFCGACGANLRAAVEGRLEQFEQVLSDADRFRRDAQYPKALALLRSAIKDHQGKLDGHIERARKLLQEYSVEQEQSLATAESTFQSALECVSNHAYENAQTLLERVPAALRNEGIEHLLGEVRSKRNEILTLGGEIRQALAEKKTLELMPKLERLIELQPKHQQAREMAAQLRLRLLEAARKQIARFKYQEALDLVQRVPAFLREQDDENILVQASELAWLTADLQTSPVVDSVLVAVAQRLHKLAPANPQAVRLQQELQQRAGKRGKDPRYPAVAWATAPQRTRVGIPVEWLGGFGRLHSEALLEKPDYVKHPGAFFVACGLALQGLEQAPVQLNLAPKKKSGLGFSLLKRKRAPQSAWGFDVGDTSLKAVRLTAGDAGKLAVDVCECIEFKKALSQPDVDFKRSEIVRAAFDELFEQHGREADRLCLSLPGAKVLGRQFDLPAIKRKKIQDAVEFEALHQIPYPLSDLIWDYQLMDESAKDGKPDDDGLQQHHVLLAAAKDYHVTDFLAVFDHMELNIDVVQSNCVALHNYVSYDLFGDPELQLGERDALAILDVGADASNVVVSARNRLWFRSLRIAGNDFTKTLMKQFKLANAHAEQLKHKPQQARRISQLYEVLTPLLEDLAAEIDRSFNMHRKAYPRQTITKLIGVGGGFQLHGLHRYLLHGVAREVFENEE
jgi:type IV pilus assembly protein PilM